MQQQLRFATTPAALLLILLVAQSTTHHGVVVLAETNTSTLRRAASTTATAHYHQYQRQRELTASSWINKLYNQVTCTNKKQQSGKCSKSSNSKNSNSSRKGNEDECENGYAEGYQDGHSDSNDNDSEEDEEEDHYENGYSSGYQDGYAEGGDSEGEDAIEDSDNEAGESESYLVANNSNNATEDSGHGLWGVGLFLAGVAGLIYFAVSVHKQRRQKQSTEQGTTELGNYVAPKARAVVEQQPVIRSNTAPSKVNIRVDTFKQAVAHDTNGNFELALLWYKEGLQQSTGLDTIIADASGKTMLDIYSNRVAELEMS